MTRHDRIVPIPVSEAPTAIAEAAEAWGAEWRGDPVDRQRGRLALPCVFGLRRGVLVGSVAIEPSGESARLTWELEESHLELQGASVALLALSLALLLPALAWPFHPPLLALLPIAAVTGLAAWWLVISRLRNSGPEEFFETIGEPHAGEISTK
ncbi:MAG: hypothetical protein AB7G12_04975 [Thermoanaerobaculia bacterium]